MLRLVAALIVAGIAAGPASAQDASLIGRWRTAAQNGVVEIHACGPALCARVVDAARCGAIPTRRMCGIAMRACVTGPCGVCVFWTGSGVVRRPGTAGRCMILTPGNARLGAP